MIRAALVLSLLVWTLQAPSKVDPASTDGWPTYNGDFTGRRFSPLTKVNDRNVKALGLGWSYR
ncbi:MAG: acido-empty-quinoprotein group A, partial [Vicinamibacterales bacterium]